MPAEIYFSLKCFGTELTGERLVSRVLAGVSDQVRTLTECLATDDAFVRLLSRVSVCVLLHVRLLMESLPAVGTGKGPDVAVDQEVSGQSGGSFEHFAAFAALKCSTSGCCCGGSAGRRPADWRVGAASDGGNRDRGSIMGERDREARVLEIRGVIFVDAKIQRLVVILIIS